MGGEVGTNVVVVMLKVQTDYQAGGEGAGPLIGFVLGAEVGVDELLQDPSCENSYKTEKDGNNDTVNHCPFCGSDDGHGKTGLLIGVLGLLSLHVVHKLVFQNVCSSSVRESVEIRIFQTLLRVSKLKGFLDNWVHVSKIELAENVGLLVIGLEVGFFLVFSWTRVVLE